MARRIKRTAWVALVLSWPVSALGGVREHDVFLQRVYGIGQEAVGIATGDFNGDGRPDLVTTGYAAAYLSLLLANESGTFDPQVRVAGDQVLLDVLVADFDGDLADDIAALGYDYVYVWLGNGDGTFGDWASYLIVEAPFWSPLAVADFNSDGKPDIVTAGLRHNILLGNGDGTFEVTYLSDGGSSYILTGDFTGDGLADIADAERVWVRSGGPSSPVFTPVTSPAPGYNGVAFDFDGDGRLDIATGGYFEVRVYLGRGNGLFDPPVVYAVPIRAYEIVLADLNGDRAPDLVVSGSARTHFGTNDPPTVLLSHGDGTFGEPVAYLAPLYGGAMVSGDFSGDGRIDVAFAPVYGQNDVAPDKDVFSQNLSLAFVMKGDGRGGLVSERVERYGVGASLDPGRGQDSIVAADLNGDALPDLATANSKSNDVSLLLGNPDGTFTASGGIAVGSMPMSLAVGFFDPGTTPDLAVANADSQDISILLGNGDATFVPAPGVSLGSAPSDLVQVDFNGDGVPDLATTNTVSGDISVLIGVGDGTFSAPASVPVGIGPIALAVIRLKDTGGPDLAVANKGSNDISVLLGNGDGTFAPEMRYPSASTTLTAIKVADVNRDGLQDVALVSRNRPHIQIFTGDGAGGLSPAKDVNFETAVFDLAILDLDGDGRLDLATTHDAGVSMLSVAFGIEGDFATRNEFATESRGRFAAGDFDGDGLPDVAIVGEFHARVAVHLNKLPVFVEFATDKSTLTWPRLLGTDAFNVYRGNLADLRDTNGDGLPEAGYGACRNALDPDPTDTSFIDGEVPVPGAGYFYLMARVRAGIETDLGSSSGGRPRVPAVTCP